MDKVHERIISSLISSRIHMTGSDDVGVGKSVAHTANCKPSLSFAADSNGGPLPPPRNNGEKIESCGDEMFLRLRREAAEVVKREPILCILLSKVGLLDASAVPNSHNQNRYHDIVKTSSESDCGCSGPAASFEEVISRIVSHRLSSSSGGGENVCPKFLLGLLLHSFNGDELELGHTMSEAVREDALAIVRRDPACETLLEAVLFMKGFHSLVLHRAARRAWKPAPRKGGSQNRNDNSNDNDGTADQNGVANDGPGAGVSGRRFVALLLQSQSSSAFGVDIHPACAIGKGVMIDHASAVVIGETATVGDGTTILHGVTLGGTGKDHGVDRHPKIGKHVLIGAGTKILGNITVGDCAKIGAGSVVLRPIPSGATAVGAPAKIIGYTPQGERPGSVVDTGLKGVEPLLGKRDSGVSTVATEGTTSTDSIATMATIQDEPAKERQKEGETEEVDGVENDSKETISEGVENAKESVDGEAENAQEKDSGGDDDDDDDDDVTDFGTPAKLHYVKVSANDGICPFRGSFCGIPSSLKDSISHSQLRALLTHEGCTEGECVEVFFALLHRTPASSKARQCGCIPFGIFSNDFPEIAKEKTRLDEETIRALARGDLRALGMSKKASRRFRSMFSALRRQCTGAKILSQIPSSGSLSALVSREDRIQKSERLRSTDHSGTDSNSDGINI